MSFPPVSTEYGDDCLLCFPAGLTPLHMYVSFAGIERGDNWFPAVGMPPNGVFDLTQNVADPCKWELFVDPTHIVRWINAVNRTQLTFLWPFAQIAFHSVVLASCRRFHVNSLVGPAGNFFYGGLAYVFTPEEIQKFIEYYTPMVDPDPQMNVTPVAGERVVIQYTDDWGDTNVSFLVDLPL